MTSSASETIRSATGQEPLPILATSHSFAEEQLAHEPDLLERRRLLVARMTAARMAARMMTSTTLIEPPGSALNLGIPIPETRPPQRLAFLSSRPACLAASPIAEKFPPSRAEGITTQSVTPQAMTAGSSR